MTKQNTDPFFTAHYGQDRTQYYFAIEANARTCAEKINGVVCKVPSGGGDMWRVECRGYHMAKV